MKLEDITFNVSELQTPYTLIPEVSSDEVRLRKTIYGKGYYNMEGVNGCEFFKVLKPISVTDLQVKQPGNKWQTLMVDDPMHWHGMKELANLANPGKVLVAGLGLGLVLHRLVERDDVDSINVIEVDPEIIKFISPYIPKDKRIKITNTNFFSFCIYNKEHYDTAIIDLWVLNKESDKQNRTYVTVCMSVANQLTKVFSNKVLIWGIRGYKIK